MASDIKKKVSLERDRNYLNRDFGSLRSELIRYAKTYFTDSISDFSEASAGGMLVEIAAYVGDVMSYYLDHQFGEIDLQTAVEDINVERLVRSAGVKIHGAAPALVDMTFYLQVEGRAVGADILPNTSVAPIISQGTLVSSTTGILFELAEDLDFSKTDSEGKPVATYMGVPGAELTTGGFSLYSMQLNGICSSAKTFEEIVGVSPDFVPFRTVTLKETNISEIISVIDDKGNNYYEVGVLSQNVVYKRVLNASDDSGLVPENIEIMLAPRRFIKTMSRSTGMTSIRFGSGRAETLDDDMVPDPSEFALPLYGDRKTFTRFTIDPNSLLNTRTLGITPSNTTLAIRYRAGGGLRDNAPARSIRTVQTLLTKFSPTTPPSKIASIRASVEVDNLKSAIGGEDAPTLNELRSLAVAARNQQNRIVTKPDLIARIYMMPPNFGRVFRIGIKANAMNPLASLISIISRDIDGKLITSPDSLKINLKKYLNEYRLVTDAIDIIDAQIINVGINYNIMSDGTSNEMIVLQNVNIVLQNYMKIENFQIDQPIVISDLMNLILNTQGVLSLVNIEIVGLAGPRDTLVYSDSIINIAASTVNNIVFPPDGGIFEMKYPSYDIVGNAF